MKYKDYYETLGISRTATPDEIKTAYRRLARKYHPDLNKEADAEAHFKEVSEAYEVLKDPEKRATYDRVGQAPDDAGNYQAPPDWNQGFSYSSNGAQHAGDENMFDGDFFESLFGHASQARQRRQPQNLDQHATIHIDLQDTFNGAQRTVTLQTQSIDANGRVTMVPRTLNITIPKGIRAGQRLRLAGQGLSGNDNIPAGDLYLEIQWQPNALYEVNDRDLSIQLPVAPWETALGAEVTIPTPQGNVSLAIPANSANGKRLRLKGRGIPAASTSGQAGDLYVILNIVYPDATTESAKAAYAALRDATHFDPRAHFPRG